MKKLISILVFAAVLLPFTGMALGADVQTFGPKTYTYTKPLIFFRDAFTTFPGPGTLSIQNGNGSSKKHVLLAYIELNGKKVAPYILPPGKTTTAVALGETNTFSIALIGPTGSFITITITQNVQPPTVSISADPLSIQKGKSSTLSWTSMYSDYCILEPGIGTVATSGSYDVSPTDTTTYTISAVGRGGTASASVTVEVTKPAYDPPTVDLSPPKAAITKGESITITWTSEGALNAYIDNGVGPVPANGSRTITPEHTTIYTLTVSGETGSARATAESRTSCSRCGRRPEWGPSQNPRSTIRMMPR